MAISDEMVVITLGYLVNYILLYKQNKFFGGIGFLGLSIALLSYSNTTVITATGLILFMGSAISLIYDFINKLYN